MAGIGLNVRQEASYFAEAQLPLAASLRSLTGRLLDSEDVARRLLAQLDECYTPLYQGNTAILESAWRERLGLLGQEVSVDLGGTEHLGKLHEIAFSGLVLETIGGEILHFQPEAAPPPSRKRRRRILRAAALERFTSSHQREA